MSTLAPAEVRFANVRDLLERLGDIPPERVRLQPAPGAATEADLLTINEGDKPVCELVDGVLVEKAMGYYESRVAGLIFHFMEVFLQVHDLGIVLSADGTLRLMPGLVRVPDVSFLAWRHFPNRLLPREPIPSLAPDLAVEVLSAGNTAREMQRKLGEYFAAGTQLVWLVEADTRRVRVHLDPDRFTLVTEDQTLDGGAVLPGFALPIRQLFERAGRRAP